MNENRNVTDLGHKSVSYVTAVLETLLPTISVYVVTLEMFTETQRGLYVKIPLSEINQNCVYKF
jgi:hypothetical protein